MDSVREKVQEDSRKESVVLNDVDSQDTFAREFIDIKKLSKNKGFYLFLKRAQDIILSLAALVILFPLFFIIALIIFIDDPKGSPFFVQERVGSKGKLFRFYKFRTMCVDAESKLEELRDMNEKDGPAFKIKDDPRVTKVGRFLRKSSLDELPQFLNILKGNMSIVGPRPSVLREVEKYDEYQKQRLLIKPGLTCYWQVQPNRDDVPFDEWVALDIKYIKERGFFTDWKIIFMTIGAVLRGSGQ